MMVDAQSYLNNRMEYAFGSMQDPDTGSRTTPSDFVKLDLVTEVGESRSTEQVSTDLINAKRYVFWRTGPKRQYVILHSSQIEIGIGEGTKQVFSQATFCEVEDLNGPGHTTAPGGNRVLASVPLAG